MKINDTVPVLIAGQVVAQARITGLEDGKATLVVPATQVVMATRTELTTEQPTEGATVQIIGEGQETEEVAVEPAPEAPQTPVETLVENTTPVEASAEAPAQETDVSE